jgi:semaphorin 6
VYATFTTDPNSIWGSAVCVFNMRAILDTFAGPFKEQEKPYSNWLPVKATNVPEPRPGQCVENSTTLTDVTLNFVKNHPLMDEAVPNFYPQPVFIRTSFE